jgi:hypothetical protein
MVFWRRAHWLVLDRRLRMGGGERRRGALGETAAGRALWAAWRAIPLSLPCATREDRKYKATFPVAPPPAPPRPPPVFLRATGSPPPAALAAGQRWMQQASRRPSAARTGAWGRGACAAGAAAARKAAGLQEEALIAPAGKGRLPAEKPACAWTAVVNHNHQCAVDAD